MIEEAIQHQSKGVGPERGGRELHSIGSGDPQRILSS